MKRVRQTLKEIVDSLMPVEASWLDKHAEDVILALKSIPEKNEYTKKDVIALLASDFKVGFTVVRLFLDQPKDEFEPKLRKLLKSSCGIGITRFTEDSDSYVAALSEMGLLEQMNQAVNSPAHWSDVLVERLKGGRGSAIKGQQRGRSLEDFVESILLEVFPMTQIRPRCRFTGANGTSTEKADFAIPNETDPQILIEAKAYGATGR